MASIKTESDISLSEGGLTTSKMEAALKTFRPFYMGDTLGVQISNMITQGRGILTLCRNSRDRIAPGRAEEMQRRFVHAGLYLAWLDTNVEMTPVVKTKTRIDLVLSQLIEPQNNIPEELVNKAKALLTKYTEENWGEGVVEDVDNDLVANTTTPLANEGQQEHPVTETELPPTDDPIFGVGGIMYGIVAVRNGKRKTYHMRTDIRRTSAKVYGNNGITLGTWYPFQINALFWGAHGARVGGIAGNVSTGAWSIVVASAYEDLDVDHGDKLYYSGSNSHDNKDPNEAAPASQGTKALQASYTTRNPIRVLRSGGASSSKNKNPYLPSCGLRYDGLYEVVGMRQRLNGNGGLYHQFELRRIEGQTPLKDLQEKSPTEEQCRARRELQT